MQPAPEIDRKRVAIVVGAWTLGFAALFVVWVAYGTKQLICFGDSSSPCNMSLMNTQIAVAAGGLIPAAFLVWAAQRRHYVLAVIALVAVLLCFLGWGVFNDAAVHGWDNLQVF